MDRLAERRQEAVQALAAPDRRAHHGDPQGILQCGQVHFNALFPGLVQEIDAQHHRVGARHHLQNQVEIPLQAGGVGYHQGGVGLAGTDEVPGDLLLGALGKEGIGAGEVHQGIGLPAVCKAATGGGNGLARPVARVLVEMGQCIKYRGLSHVGISRQGDGIGVISQW